MVPTTHLLREQSETSIEKMGCFRRFQVSVFGICKNLQVLHPHRIPRATCIDQSSCFLKAPDATHSFASQFFSLGFGGVKIEKSGCVKIGSFSNRIKYFGMEVETFWDVKIEKIGMKYYSLGSLTANAPEHRPNPKGKGQSSSNRTTFQGRAVQVYEICQVM